MKVIISKVSGFCGGVRRAINLAHEARRRCVGQVYVDGELVHNRQVMKDLADAGIKLLGDDDFGHIAPEDCVVIRAHGIQGNRRRQLENCFSHIADGTCPHVSKVSKAIGKASDDGRDVIIIGDGRHPEVLALIDAAKKGRCFPLNSAEEIQSLPHHLNRVLVIAQSTIDGEFFNNLAAEIAKAYPDTEIQNTICGSSRDRQGAIADLKKEGARAIIVVGGKHSNNTAILAKTAKNLGLPVFHIETADNLPIWELGKFSAVGIASGASADEKTVLAVVAALQKI